MKTPSRRINVKNIAIGAVILLPIAVYAMLCSIVEPRSEMILSGLNSVRLASNGRFKISYTPRYDVYSMPGDAPSDITNDEGNPNSPPPLCAYHVPALDGHDIQIGRLIFFVVDEHVPGTWVFRKCQ
jgi:hypothetical protein